MADDPKSKHNTREYIKKTFLAIYKNKPLGQIYISDLIKACSIARGTFYFHFDNIETLYRECEKDIIDKMEADLDNVVICTVGVNEEEFTKVYTGLIKNYRDDLEAYKCLLCGSEEASFRSAWFESIRRNYEKTMRFSKETSPARREYLTRFFAGGVLALLSSWVLNDCREPAEDIASVEAQALFNGVFK